MQWKSKAEKSSNVCLYRIVVSGMTLISDGIDVLIGKECSIHSFKEVQPPNTILSRTMGRQYFCFFGEYSVKSHRSGNLTVF